MKYIVLILCCFMFQGCVCVRTLPIKVAGTLITPVAVGLDPNMTTWEWLKDVWTYNPKETEKK